MKSHQMRTFPIRRVVEHSSDTRTFSFDAPFDAVPGQFVSLWLPGVDEKPYSVSELHDSVMEITVCGVGPFSNKMLECKVGDRVGIRGPFGNGFALRDHMLLVGGGMGLAPMYFLARSLRRAGHSYRILAGARSAEKIVFLNDFRDMGAEFATDDGSIGHHGIVTDVLTSLLESGPASSIAACGPELMLTALRDVLEPTRHHYQFALERYMKCGIGICGSCCLDGNGARVCVEGPVFNRRALESVTDLGLPHRTAAGLRGRSSKS